MTEATSADVVDAKSEFGFFNAATLAELQRNCCSSSGGTGIREHYSWSTSSKILASSVSVDLRTRNERRGLQLFVSKRFIDLSGVLRIAKFKFNATLEAVQ